jgi:hypothetical protein
MPGPTTDPDHPARYRWYVLVVLIATGVFSVADRLVLSILLEDIKAEFALSDTQLGLLTGLAFSLFWGCSPGWRSRCSTSLSASPSRGWRTAGRARPSSPPR